MIKRLTPFLFVFAVACSTAPITPPVVAPPPPVSGATSVEAASIEPPRPEPPVPVPVRIGLALGGGAARGFAHIGAIKALEAHGIVPDIVTGTSAGSIVGALYAAGLDTRQIERMALAVQESQLNDWGLPDRGVIKGEALQTLVNRAVGNRPIEKLTRPFGVVATDLRSGERLVFRTGNTGMAVRASSAVPGLFKPVEISGREYVDGGLTSPVPVRAAREMGADFVIAVDISAQPRHGQTNSTFNVLMQTFTIMGQSISRHEVASADALIRPAVGAFSATDFTNRRRAMDEGEKAVLALIEQIKSKLELLRYPQGRAAK